MKDDNAKKAITDLKEKNENVLTFMYQSISDTQATIKSIDTKLGFILILNIIPITNVGKIYSGLFLILSTNDGCIIQILKAVIIVMCAILWLLACICTYRGIAAIDNPLSHIKAMNKQTKGTFYSGGLYNRNLIDAVFNRSSIVSEKAFAEYCKDMPSTKIEIFEELIFEKMKLAYIRDMKLIRQLWAFRFTVCWVIMGLIIYAIKVKNVLCTVSK
jgi:hypothetical protein